MDFERIRHFEHAKRKMVELRDFYVLLWISLFIAILLIFFHDILTEAIVRHLGIREGQLRGWIRLNILLVPVWWGFALYIYYVFGMLPHRRNPEGAKDTLIATWTNSDSETAGNNNRERR